MLYVNQNRSTGSQREIPSINIKDNEIQITGYQKFKIIGDEIKHNNKKLSFISEYVKDLDINTISDLGCSNGLLCCLLKDYDIIGYDHDDDCLDLHMKISDYVKLDTKKWKFGDEFRKSDVVIMLALIHWVFSCTSLYGSFIPIIEYLYNYTNKYLIIEWVDKDDSAIKSFKHTSYNKDIVKEEYNFDNFILSISKYFNYKKIYDISKTRQIYLCEKK